jgi:excisionase family DNA binding protein
MLLAVSSAPTPYPLDIHPSISRTKVYELLRNGELESLRIGTSRRIPAAALAEYVGDFEKVHGLRRIHGLSIRPFSGRDGATETNWETWIWPRDAEGKARVRSTAGGTVSGSEVWISA